MFRLYCVQLSVRIFVSLFSMLFGVFVVVFLDIMKHLHCLSWVGLLGLAVLTTAKDVSYVTDLEIFTYLVRLLKRAPVQY
jgi:hypothetical protein